MLLLSIASMCVCGRGLLVSCVFPCLTSLVFMLCCSITPMFGGYYLDMLFGSAVSTCTKNNSWFVCNCSNLAQQIIVDISVMFC